MHFTHTPLHTHMDMQADPLSSIKIVNEDTQRALAALNSKEAAAAFEAGGGGK